MKFGFLFAWLRALASRLGQFARRGIAFRHAFVAIASLALLGADIASADADVDLGTMSLSQAQNVCRDANTHPWMSGVALAQPGRWWNTKRYGTGWDLVYSDDRKQLKVFLYTYDGNGHPVWLASKMTLIDPSGDYWRADLYEYTMSTAGVIDTGTDVGDVYFRPSSTRAKWKATSSTPRASITSCAIAWARRLRSPTAGDTSMVPVPAPR